MHHEDKKERIKEETRKLLDKFSGALRDVRSEESNVERDSDRRQEKEGEKGKECDSDFRRIMFENASQKNEDFIFAEKKTW